MLLLNGSGMIIFLVELTLGGMHVSAFLLVRRKLNWQFRKTRVLHPKAMNWNVLNNATLYTGYIPNIASVGYVGVSSWN